MKERSSIQFSDLVSTTPYQGELSSSSYVSRSPEETFSLGEEIGNSLKGGEVILLFGALGAGKTLLTKGVLNALEFDIDEVTSPSFTLVNLYKGKFEVYHIDLWRIDENSDAAAAVGLDEILENENAVVIVEWAERLKRYKFGSRVIRVTIEGDGEEPRRIEIDLGGKA
jgi:tRNA threonylcarbamoyladenosine biosynthesis protein TsaE